jgi:PrtD family type I secretion system ABC transporter
MQHTPVAAAFAACRASFLAVIVFSFCINLLALASPLYMMQIYDHVLASRSGDTLIMLTLIVLLALAVLSLLEAIRRQILVRLSEWLDDRMGPSVFAGGVEAALLHKATGRNAQGLRDLATLRSFIGGPALVPLLDAPWAPIFIVMLFALHPLLGLIGLGGAILLFSLAILNESVTRRPLERAGIAAARSYQTAEASVRNAEVVHAMGMLDGMISRWLREGEAARAAQTLAARRGTVILAISRFSRLTIQTVVMGAGAWLVIEKGGSAGMIFASSFLLSRGLAPVENAIGTWKSLVSARTAYRQLTELLGASPESGARMELPPPRGGLVLEQVTFAYPGAEEPTLRGVSFTLAPGESLAIVGPSAAGKSTLARLLVSSQRPTAGHVRLDGADLSVWLAAGGARNIGYLPQDIELFAGSVRDNIARFTKAEASDVIEAATCAGLHETIMRLPESYDTEIGDGGLKLSGGQRQRLALARALLGRPRLIVLDEPNSSLDEEGEAALRDALLRLKELGTTVVVVTHRMHILNLVDKLLVLRHGVVDAFGARPEVLARLNAAAAAAVRRTRLAAVEAEAPAHANEVSHCP